MAISAKKKKQSQRAKSGMSWRDVTPAHAPELMLGDEGGFMSLEEMDGEVFISSSQSTGAEAGKTDRLKESPKRKRKGGKVAHTRKLSEQVPAVGVASPFIAEEKSSKKRKKRTLRSGERTEESGREIEEKIAEAVEERIDGQQGRAKKRRASGPHPKLQASDGAESAVDDAPVEAAVLNEVSRNAKTTKKKKKKGPRKSITKGNTIENGGDVGAQGTEEGPERGEVAMEAWMNLRLHPLLIKALAELGFRKPSPIQEACIPPAAHQGKDLVGAAETGSGKTLAFGLPILQRLLEEREKAVRQRGMGAAADSADEQNKALRALVVAPTRELALQVSEHLRAAAKYADVRVVPIVGGMAPQKQQRLLRMRPEVVVGTPGRLWELMSAGEPHLLQLNQLSFFVLDEADRMVEKGHFSELQTIIEQLPVRGEPRSGNPAPERNEDIPEVVSEVIGVEAGLEPNLAFKKRQTLVFSATLALPDGFRKKLKRKDGRRKGGIDGPETVAALIQHVGMSPNAAIVDLTTKDVVASKLEEAAIECVEEEKDALLYYMARMHGGGRALVFCTSVAAVRRVAALLQLLAVPAWPLHAQMQQQQRLKALDRYKEALDGILVATDVAARGLDIPGIRTVIHFQLPHSAEVYVHRCGRTARAGADGCSLALISPKDRAKYSALMRALSKDRALPEFPVDASYLPQIRKCVQMARKLDEKLRKGSLIRAEKTWIQRNSDMLELDAGGMEEGKNKKKQRPGEDDDEGGASKRETAELRRMRKELHGLLEEALRPRSFSKIYFAGKGISSSTAQQVLQLKGPRHKGAGMPSAATGGRRSRFTVIGHESTDAIAALRQVTGI